MGKLINETGNVYGYLTVIKQVESAKRNHTKWLCRCKCGTEKAFSIDNLRCGYTKSCGCLKNHQKGNLNNHWKGGRQKLSKGYIQIYKPEHPNADKHGYIAEHVYVMSQHIGRPLEKGETVHHGNGIKDQNNIENLELWVSSHPAGQRVSDLIKWAKDLLLKYDLK